jgi:hypothetical protein
VRMVRRIDAVIAWLMIQLRCIGSLVSTEIA